jgi:hypothetical protein
MLVWLIDGEQDIAVLPPALAVAGDQRVSRSRQVVPSDFD